MSDLSTKRSGMDISSFHEWWRRHLRRAAFAPPLFWSARHLLLPCRLLAPIVLYLPEHYLEARYPPPARSGRQRPPILGGRVPCRAAGRCSSAAVCRRSSRRQSLLVLDWRVRRFWKKRFFLRSIAPGAHRFRSYAQRARSAGRRARAGSAHGIFTHLGASYAVPRRRACSKPPAARLYAAFRYLSMSGVASAETLDEQTFAAMSFKSP